MEGREEKSEAEQLFLSKGMERSLARPPRSDHPLDENCISSGFGTSRTRPIDINKVSLPTMDRPTRGQMKNAEAGDQCKYIHDVGWIRACVRVYYIYIYIHMYTHI